MSTTSPISPEGQQPERIPPPSFEGHSVINPPDASTHPYASTIQPSGITIPEHHIDEHQSDTYPSTIPSITALTQAVTSEPQNLVQTFERVTQNLDLNSPSLEQEIADFQKKYEWGLKEEIILMMLGSFNDEEITLIKENISLNQKQIDDLKKLEPAEAQKKLKEITNETEKTYKLIQNTCNQLIDKLIMNIGSTVLAIAAVAIVLVGIAALAVLIVASGGTGALLGIGIGAFFGGLVLGGGLGVLSGYTFVTTKNETINPLIELRKKIELLSILTDLEDKKKIEFLEFLKEIDHSEKVALIKFFKEFNLINTFTNLDQETKDELVQLGSLKLREKFELLSLLTDLASDKLLTDHVYDEKFELLEFLKDVDHSEKLELIKLLKKFNLINTFTNLDKETKDEIVRLVLQKTTAKEKTKFFKFVLKGFMPHTAYINPTLAKPEVYLNENTFLEFGNIEKWNILKWDPKENTKKFDLAEVYLSNLCENFYPKVSDQKITDAQRAAAFMTQCLNTSDAQKSTAGKQAIAKRVIVVIDILNRNFTEFNKPNVSKERKEQLEKIIKGCLDIMARGGSACPDRAIVHLREVESHLKLFEYPEYTAEIFANMFKLQVIQDYLVDPTQAENIETFLKYTLELNNILGLGVTGTMLYAQHGKVKSKDIILPILGTAFTAENLINYTSELSEFRLLYENEKQEALATKQIELEQAVDAQTDIYYESNISDEEKEAAAAKVAQIQSEKNQIENSFFADKARQLFLDAGYLSEKKVERKL